MKPRDRNLCSRGAVSRLGMALLCGVMLAGCQSPRQSLQDLAGRYGQQLEVLPTQPFPLLLGTPAVVRRSSRLRIYLEGDGRAWATPRQPSVDPSPRNLLVARLAFDDSTPSLYLSRPCQFVSASGCTQNVWTNQRFSQEVVDSLSQALDQLKNRYGNRDFELVGYSGGAALALLLAAQRNDIRLVQTIAGNLSPALWAQMLGLTPLRGSLDPLHYRDKLASLPQRHLVGNRDRIVPVRLAELYLQALINPTCIQLHRVPDTSHDKGWETAWKQWRDRPLLSQCSNQLSVID